jgi:hypothetical protein
MRVAAGLLASMVAAPMVAGCGTAPSSAGSVDTVALPPDREAALRYTCGGIPFAAAAIEGNSSDELAEDPTAAALRAHLAKADMDIDWLPDSGWTFVGRDATHAEYVTDGGDQGFFSVTLAKEVGPWQVTGWGGCSPMRVLPEGVGNASWAVAPGQSIGPATMRFEALVTEQACASGRSSEGRVVGPDILEVDDEMLVTFGVRSLPGDQECPGNAPTRVVIVLPEPLGDRRLLDGSTLPPRQPVAEP